MRATAPLRRSREVCGSDRRRPWVGWRSNAFPSCFLDCLSAQCARCRYLWGLLTLVTAVWVGRRWLGPVGAAILALLFSFGNDVWFFALELKQYSADTFGGLLVPSLAAWVVEVPADRSSGIVRRADGWWIVSGILQWFSYGALFVTPACGIAIAAMTGGVQEPVRRPGPPCYRCSGSHVSGCTTT